MLFNPEKLIKKRPLHSRTTRVRISAPVEVLKPQVTVQKKSRLSSEIDVPHRCCSLDCWKNFTFKNVETDRAFYKNLKTMKEQHKFVLNYLTPFSSNRSIMDIKINNLSVCKKYFRIHYGISQWRYKQISREICQKIPLTRKQKLKKKARKTVDIKRFFDRITDISEISPNGNEIHVPSDLDESGLFALYLDQTNTLEPAKLSQFRNVHKKEFKNIKIAPPTGLGSCDTCNDEKAKKFITTSENLNDIKLHLQLQATERLLYKQRQDQAITCPANFISLIIDGAGPKVCPHKYPIDKSVALVKRFKLSIHAIIDHQKRNTYEYYINLAHYPNDSNYTISLLHHKLCKILQDATRANGVRPSILKVQVDNCWRENKNKYMLAYLSYLIHLKWFKEIEMHSLIQGHTHEDIDQLFSLWTLGQRTFSYVSMSELREFLKNVYNNKIYNKMEVNYFSSGFYITLLPNAFGINI